MINGKIIAERQSFSIILPSMILQILRPFPLFGVSVKFRVTGVVYGRRSGLVSRVVQRLTCYGGRPLSLSVV